MKFMRSKYSYGMTVQISNSNLPGIFKYIGLSDPVKDTYGGDDSAFLWPVSEPTPQNPTPRGNFILESPPDIEQKTGPVKTGDTVVLRVGNRGTPDNPAYLMRGKYMGKDKEIEALMKNLPAVHTRKVRGVDDPSRILRFKVVVEQYWALNAPA